MRDTNRAHARLFARAGLTLAVTLIAHAAPAQAEQPRPATPQPAAAGVGEPASDGDRYIGYYYPAPAETEDYGPRVQTMPEASERTRVAFVTGLSNQMLRNAYPPAFILFAKGDGSRKLIMTGLDDQHFATLYRMRAWLAGLTATARSTPVFSEIGAPPEHLTFLDLLKLLGFEDLVISDGRTLAHRIRLR